MKVFFDTIGCRLNQAEIERYAAQLHAAGNEIVGTANEAELVIVNTCAVTAAAAADSRSKIRKAGANGAAVAVTGCWSTMEPSKAAALPNVRFVIPNAEKDRLPGVIFPDEPFDVEPIKREILPGIHARTRAFIKVQDGCDNHCTFCVTHLLRGKARSVPESRVLSDVENVIRSEGKEIVLTGVNLGAWGLDLQPKQQLTNLIWTLLDQTTIPRIRLSSLESWNLSEEFVNLWNNPRLCPHFHIPLQSGSISVLKRMARRTTPEEFIHLVTMARAIRPDFAITTDVIVGFPGETEEEFKETLAFIQKTGFAGGHVFTFSPRPGTAAAKMEGQLPKSILRERSKILRCEFDRQKISFQKSFIGKERQILWESSNPLPDGQWETYGLSDNYLTVKTIFPHRVHNEITTVLVTNLTDDLLTCTPIQ